MQPNSKPKFPFKIVVLVIIVAVAVISLLVMRAVVQPAQQAPSGVARPVNTPTNKSQIITPYDTTVQTPIDLTKYPLYHFKNDNINTVMGKLWEWYHIDYTYQDSISNKFTGSVPIGVPIEESLRVLAKMGNVYFKMSPPGFVVVAVDTVRLYN